MESKTKNTIAKYCFAGAALLLAAPFAIDAAPALIKEWRLSTEKMEFQEKNQIEKDKEIFEKKLVRPYVQIYGH